LKQHTWAASSGHVVVPPGLTAGGGLKHDPVAAETADGMFPPASPPGAD